MRRRIARRMLTDARKRAAEKGVPFDMEVEDIVIPHYCPVFGFELKVGAGPMTDASPTLDRIVPERGYVKGNTIVVSNRANRLKGDATVDELGRIASFYSQLVP